MAPKLVSLEYMTTAGMNLSKENVIQMVLTGGWLAKSHRQMWALPVSRMEKS